MKGWQRWAAVAALLAAVGASAYLWWWKPLVLASLRYGLDQALAGTEPRITFRSVDLSGLSTLVVRDVRVGSLDDANSLQAREARLSFNLRALIRGRFDFAGALRKVVLVGPQAILAWPDLVLPARKNAVSTPALPIPPQAVVEITDGRVLLRAGGAAGQVLTLHDVDAAVARTPAGGWTFSADVTAPGSPRRGLSVTGTWGDADLKLAIKASRLRVAPLRPWLEPFKLPLRLDDGALSASLDLDLTKEATGGRRAARGQWRLARADGRLDADGVSVAAPGLPLPVANLSGRARASGTRVSLERVMFTTSGTAWVLAGIVEDFDRPKVHLEFGAPAFQLSLVSPGAAGGGPVRLRAEGPAESPVITAIFDLRNVEAVGLSATRTTGTLTIEDWGRHIQLEGGRAQTPAGVLTLAGAGSPRAGTADATFAIVPQDALLPQLSGTLTLRNGEVKSEVKTGDGLWTIRGRGRKRGVLWTASADAAAAGGARISLAGTAGVAAPHRLDAQIAVSNASFAVLYLERRNDIFRRLPLTIGAAASVRGTTADPALSANLAGSRLALGRTSLPVTGTLKISRRGLDLVPVKAGSAASVTLSLPFGGAKPAGAKVTGEGFPLRLVWAIVPVAAAVRDLEGSFFGTLDIADLTGRPTIEGGGEIRELAWAGTKLGTLGFTVDAQDRTMKLTALSLKGPLAAGGGDGSLTIMDDGWNGTGRLNISYCKIGTTDLDAHAEVSASSGPKGLATAVKLTALRMNAAAWPDAEVEIAVPDPGSLTVKASWEDVLSAVWESRAGRSVALSASFSDLSLAPLLGMVHRSAPVDQLTGSISLKGSPDRASLKADLRWARGEATVRGWVASPAPSSGSITVHASDRAVAQWCPFLRSLPHLKDLPDFDGSLATRGFTAEWAPERLGVNGWITIRDASVRGRAVGSGSVRIKRSGVETEIEGTVAGDAGEFVLFPTRITETANGRDVTGAFGWRRCPAGMTFCTCARGTLTLRIRGDHGEGSLVLTGLALGDLVSPDLTFRFDGDGGVWSLSSPRESLWQAIGTVSAAGGRIAVLPDDRVGGRWVVLKGPDGAQVKLSGVWPLPNSPEKLGFEGHRLPAAPIMVAIGAPSQEGLAEADLDYVAAATPPLSGRLSLNDGRWGDFAYDLFEVRGTGTPGHDFTFTAIRIERAGDLKAKGTGSLTLVPDRAIVLDLSIEKLALRYLRPFGFVEDSDSNGLGRIRITGDYEDPEIAGSLICTPGAYTPPTAFAELRLAEGRIDFKGHGATLTATLNDTGGASVLVAGEGSFRKLQPTDYTVSMTAPTWIVVDGLPRLYKGLAKGRIRIEGSLAAPAFRGEIQVQQGRMQTPPKTKNPDPASFAERVDWDLKVKFGDGVTYAVEPLAGAAVDLARLSPKSYLHVKGKGAGFEVFGEILADSGPVTIIMGKRLYRKEAP
ncbi:MAG: hypothetical protein AAB152_14840 [Candidatus Coatesbacteria bacterium]